jgi:hypothetical protein
MVFEIGIAVGHDLLVKIGIAGAEALLVFPLIGNSVVLGFRAGRAGVTEATPKVAAAEAVPWSETTTGLVLEVALSVRLPVTSPALAGSNVTVITWVSSGARENGSVKPVKAHM